MPFTACYNIPMVRLHRLRIGYRIGLIAEDWTDRRTSAILQTRRRRWNHVIYIMQRLAKYIRRLTVTFALRPCWAACKLYCFRWIRVMFCFRCSSFPPGRSSG